jgi:YggT family protein
VILPIIHDVLFIYLLILFGRAILSWFPIQAESPMASVQRGLYAVTEPVLAPLRAVLPPMRMGGMGLDLSPMLVMLVIIVLLNVIPG